MSLEKTLSKKISPFIPEVAPSLELMVYHKGKKKIHLKLGDEYKYYDLASLTKIIFTVPVLMSLYENKKIKVEQPIIEILPWVKWSEVKVKNLLNHSSGLIWWQDFFRKLDQKKSMLEKRYELAQMIRSAPREQSNKSVYSDVGFLFLGFLIERIKEKPLFDIFLDLQKDFKLSESLHFQKNNQTIYKKSLYAPTENCLWRKFRPQGEVHDENCWAMGGVSNHAGLFGQAQDVADYGLRLREVLNSKNKFLSSSTLKLFMKRTMLTAQGDWALGFMLPSKGSSSAGKYLSSDSIGHTGFAGTSFWYDPKKDLQVTLLSNRVYHGREKEKFKLLRPKIHDWIFESMKDSL